MTDTSRPPACHYDRTLGARVTRTHRDDCPTQQPADDRPCPGRDGCTPCTAPHCVLCTRRHLDNNHPLTCPDCIAQVRDDLHEIRWLCRHLRWQAARGGRDGHLTAAAPIPGGDALVMYATRDEQAEALVWQDAAGRDTGHENHPDDPMPPLLPLLGWAHQWRTWQNRGPLARPSLSGVIGYLLGELHLLAQATDGPDWLGFARDIADLRRALERVLHDEQDPERGVPCFECGDRLVRTFGRPRPCRHVREARAAGVTITQWIYTLSTYPELDDDHTRCLDQGGIADPSVGQSWECEGCRKHYTAGEYANAVRSHLLIGGPDGDGWTHIAMAAEAATTMTQVVVAPSTVRRWMDRGKVLSVCRWVTSVDGAREVPAAPGPSRDSAPGHDALIAAFAGRVHSSPGLRLVFWPSVAEQAALMVERAQRAAAERARVELQRERLHAAVRAGEDLDKAGARLGIHPARVARFEAEWDAESRREESA